MTRLLSPADQPARLLFCCVENQCRSQMAEAFARLHGDSRLEANSAGIRPSGRVHSKAVAAMLERGYDLNQHWSKGFTEIPDVEFDVVVSIGCGGLRGRVRARHFETWDVPVPKDMPTMEFRAVRDQIEENVKELLVELGILGRDARPAAVVSARSAAE
jgi:protein-tyrosine-phosphatase